MEEGTDWKFVLSHLCPVSIFFVKGDNRIVKEFTFICFCIQREIKLSEQHVSPTPTNKAAQNYINTEKLSQTKITSFFSDKIIKHITIYRYSKWPMMNTNPITMMEILVEMILM